MEDANKQWSRPTQRAFIWENLAGGDEMRAMNVCVIVLDELKPAEADRVARYLLERFARALPSPPKDAP